MKLSDMKIGTALVLRKEKGVNDTYNDSIKEGELFVEVRIDEDSWLEYPLAEQPKKSFEVKFSADDFEDVK